MTDVPAPAFDGKAFAAQLSTAPGVYRMYAADDTLLYVGKARALRNRVGSYFVRWLDLAMHFVDPELGPDGLRRGETVAGCHHDAQAAGVEGSYRVGGTGLDGVGHREDAREAAVHRQVHDAGAFRAQPLSVRLQRRTGTPSCSINAVLPNARRRPSTVPRTPMPLPDSNRQAWPVAAPWNAQR